MNSRVAIVLSHPIQYYSPWFRWLAQNTNLTLRVFYLWEAGSKPAHDVQFDTTFAWDVDLLSGYDSEFVPNTSSRPGTDHFGGLRNPALLNRLRDWRPDVILLFGYNYLTHLRLIFLAKVRKVPLIFRGDSHLLGRENLPFVKRSLLGLLFRQFQAFLCTGMANQAYFRYLGVPESRLFLAPHCVDGELFKPDAATRARAAQLRSDLSIPPQTRVLLFAGKLVPAKQPTELLIAFMELAAHDTVLVFVGEGEDKAGLQSLATKAPPGSVHFLPFANQSEMPTRYQMADLFVLPSRGHYETWGLAVNEAMHMGVPCIVSDRVGCQQDLVTNGETGWVFNVEDSLGLLNALQHALVADRETMKPQIARRIAQYTYAQATHGLILALDHIRKLSQE